MFLAVRRGTACSSGYAACHGRGTGAAGSHRQRSREPVTVHGFTLTLVGASDIGRARPRNEDSFELRPALGLAVVADGMGGHPGGDVASRVAVAAAVEAMSERLAGDASPPPLGEDRLEHLRRAMAASVLHAHAAVHAEAATNPRLRGMGTTLSVLLLDEPSAAYVIGNVGDSRIYRLRDGVLRQLTRDDTWVQARVDEELLSPEQARDHPFGHMLSQCVGLDNPPVPRVLFGPLAHGDIFLACTDGLTGMLVDGVLAGELAASAASAPEKCVEKLIGLANRAGGRDNVTVALAVVEGTPDPS